MNHPSSRQFLPAPLRQPLLAGLAALALAPLAAAQGQDLIIPSGSTVVYNTAVSGPIEVNRFIIERDATFAVVGTLPLKISAASVEIDGTLSASGQNNSGVTTLNTTNQPSIGSPGAAGGGSGGTGSVLTNASTPAGLPGDEAYGIQFPGLPPGGGQGGETGYAPLGPMAKENRRGAGGGGGALAANQPVSMDPFAEENIGLIALPGMDGGPNGTGAISGTMRAAGGLPGLPVFQDGNPDNDFWGMKVTPTGTIIGEVRRPLPGRGGGAGGDAVASATFPLSPFFAGGDEKGAGGGGGGGLVLIVARTFRLGEEGRLMANGGHGGGGENTIFFDRVGGGSGGGSGGWIVLESPMMNLSQASDASITALGGRGGEGRENRFPGGPFGNDIPGAGGNGGPGVIQLHVPTGQPSMILLPPNKTLEDLTQPDAHVLLPALTQ
ncbi:hypothetical protein Poly30_19960 [Planctomycetes bacterium Poly30]|uniref:Uncharacterized protein n=1 Tax=Saltatorellus ferox TaxID=2528018 RepID=A0A518EQW5_9BACT|nr:hypothetical protein Poly30_19960 [Planctomycetes bacterium Poly30]